MEEITLRKLKWHITDIRSIDKDSLIVVAGEFNLVGMEIAEFLERKFRLKPVLSKHQPTHRLGRHLDNIWTNFPTTKVEIIQSTHL